MPYWAYPITGPELRETHAERAARLEQERLARVAADPNAGYAIDPATGSLRVMSESDLAAWRATRSTPSAGDSRRPTCEHDRIAEECWLCANPTVAIPDGVRAVGDTDRILWRNFGDARMTEARALVWRAFREIKPRRALVALSGGKDSTVTLAVVRSIVPAVHVLWTDDEMEYPESVDYIGRLERAWDLDLTVRLSPATHAGWFRPWTDRPYWREPEDGALPSGGIPTREWQADEGYDLIFTGVRAQESWRRRDHLLVHGPLYRTIHGWVCNPIWDWSADDVWAAIGGLDLPYNPVYDTLTAIGVERDRQRVGPLPLARRIDLEVGWPEMYSRLVARYGQRW